MKQSDQDHLNWLTSSTKFNFKNSNILDLGCGSGALCKYFAKNGAQKCIGIDLLNPDYKNESWSFLKEDLNSQSWYNKLMENEKIRYHSVLAFDILEHLDSPWTFLKNVHALLEKNGSLYLTTPNLNSWERFIRPHSWSGVIDEQHKHLFNKYSLQFICKKAGFQVEKMKSPIRSLTFINEKIFDFGGQIFCHLRK